MSDDHLNLREMVLDSLFAALPVLPLCRQTAAGLPTGAGPTATWKSAAARRSSSTPLVGAPCTAVRRVTRRAARAPTGQARSAGAAAATVESV